MLKDQFESYAYLLLLVLSRTPTPHLPAKVPTPSEAVGYAKAAVDDVGGPERVLQVATSAVRVIGKDVVEKVATDLVVGVIKG